MARRVTVGVDLGGTRIRLLANASPANWSRRVEARAPTFAHLPEFLERLWRRWRLSRHDVDALVVAAKGVWTASERRGQERDLRRLARRVRVISDAEAAFMGALGDSSGVLVLAGTGSIVLGRTSQGRWVRRGGLGPLLGDEGSAFWIGREWLKATTRAEEFEQVRRLVRSPDAPTRIAKLAANVLRHARKGNKVARRIVAEAQRHLAVQATEVVRAAGLSSPITVSWAGKLLEDRRFRVGLWRTLRGSGLSLRVIPPRESAVRAAARLALALAASR